MTTKTNSKSKMQDAVRKETQGLNEAELKDVLARVNAMAKTNGKSKAAPKEVEHKFSFEFLDMLTGTASDALHEYFKKTKASEDVAQLVDMVSCLFLEQLYILEGSKQDVKNVADYVTRTVHHIAALGGEWHDPTGSITPLKERLAYVARKAKGK